MILIRYKKSERKIEMKIAIPVEEKSFDMPVCVSFGRTPFFALFDTENGKYEYIENTACDSPGGAGIKASQILIDNGVNVVITVRCGENACEVLTPAGIKLYKSVDGSVMSNIEKFDNGELMPLTEIHKGLHHGG